MPERFKVLSTIDLRSQGGSSTSLPFPVSAKYPSHRLFPSLKQSEGEGSSIVEVGKFPSRVPLTSDDLPLLTKLRKDFIEGIPIDFSNLSLNHSERKLCLSKTLEDNDFNLMELCYRLSPAQGRFIKHCFAINKKMLNRFKYICNNLGLTVNSIPYYTPDVLSYSRLGRGLCSIVNETTNKIILELLTFYNGKYGRLIILVSIGVCCTIWYLFLPGIADAVPPEEIFQRFDSYQEFYNADINKPLFKKICFIERTYISDEVLKTIENEYPFSDMEIPATGSTRIAVGLGLIIGVFLAAGIVPLMGSVPEISQ